jgi:hypothetical protein
MGKHDTNLSSEKALVLLRHGVTDRPVTRRKSVTFDNKAKVGMLVQRARTFKKQKLAEEAEEEAREEQQALACAMST